MIKTYSSAKIVLLLFIAHLWIPTSLMADGADKKPLPKVRNQELDPRMPPVVPGEEVVRNGKTIKVWSTSGSPSEGSVVSQPPSLQQEWTDGTQQGQGIGVIVDGRDLLPRR